MHIEDLMEPKKQRGKSFDLIWWSYLVGAPLFLLSSFSEEYTNIPVSFDIIDNGKWTDINGLITLCSISDAHGKIKITTDSVPNLLYWNFLEQFLLIVAFGLIIFAMKKISNSLIDKQLFNKKNINWLRLIAIVFLYLFTLHPLLEASIGNKAIEHLTHNAINPKKMNFAYLDYTYFFCSVFFFTLVWIFKEGKNLKEDADLTI